MILQTLLLLATATTALYVNQSSSTSGPSNSTNSASIAPSLRSNLISSTSGLSTSTSSAAIAPSLRFNQISSIGGPSNPTSYATTIASLHSSQPSSTRRPSNSTSSATTTTSLHANQSSPAGGPSNVSSNASTLDFIDCSNYSTLASTPTTYPMSFQEYWCTSGFAYSPANGPDNFDNNGELTPAFFGLDPSVRSYCLSLEAADYSSHMRNPTATAWSIGTFVEPPVWSPTITPPCCNTFCDISAASAQMFYWPTPAPSPGISTLVGPDGFTYTSPSVYVVYMGISATNDCGEILGSTTAITTMSYHESDISTFIGTVAGYQTLNFGDLFSNCTTSLSTRNDAWCNSQTSMVQFSECFLQTESNPSSADSVANYNHNHCFPQLPYPSNLQAINPAWASCADTNLDDFWNGIFDPPRTLAPAPALVSNPTKDMNLPTSAAPAPHASQPGPPITAPPSTSSSVNLPGNDPQNGNTAGPSKDPPISNLPIVPQNPLSSSSDNPQPNPGALHNTFNLPNDPASSPLLPAPNTPTNTPGSPKSIVQTDTGPGNGTPGSSSDPATDPGDESANSSPQQSDQVQNPAPDPTEPTAGATPIPIPISTFAVPIASDQTLSGAVISPNVVVIAGSTMKAGASAAQILSHEVYIDPLVSNIVVDGQTQALPPQNPLPSISAEDNSLFAAPSPTTVNGHVIQAVASSPSALLVDGQTLTLGGSPITVSGTPIALNSENNLILGTTTLEDALPTPVSPQVSYFTVGNETLTLSSSLLIAAGQTLKAGQPVITVGGAIVSLGPSALQIGTSTLALAFPTSQPSASVIIAAGQPVTVLPNAVVIAGTTLATNAPGVTISGTPISFGSNGLIVGTSTIPLPLQSSDSVITAAGQAVTILPNAVVIAGKTLATNSPAITISGTPVSLGSNGLIVGTSIIPLLSQSADSVITLAGQVATLKPSLSELAIAGTTIRIGEPTLTIAGTPIALGSSGLVVGTSTIPLPLQASTSLITVAGQVATIYPAQSELAIAGTTLTVGSPTITISGTLIALGSSGLVIGTSTIPLPLQSSTSLITIAGQVATMYPAQSEVAVAGTTLTVGGPTMTISGTPIALGSSGLIVGTSIIPYPGTNPSSTAGIGGLIFAGLNGGIMTPSAAPSGSSNNQSQMNSSAPNGSVEPFLGSAGQIKIPWDALGAVILLASFQRAILGI